MSDFYNQRQKEFFVISKNSPRRLPSLIKDSIDVRIITNLLSEKSFLDNILQTEDSLYLLQRLTFPTGRLSYLSLCNLIRAFFLRFQYILAENQEFLSEMAELIKNSLSRLSTKFMSSDLSKFSRYRNTIFFINGPSIIAKEALKEEMELYSKIKKLGLVGYDDTDYFNLCKYNYYIETLRNIPVGSDHKILNEISRKEVYEAAATDGRLLGHEILEILIDRSPVEAPSDRWLNIIFAIAGDPRVNRSSTKYQKWWAFLNKELIDKVTGWLSRVDLRLFFKILKDYSKERGDLNLKRMFPAREQFLIGLIDQGLVYHTRLFVSNSASKYLKKLYKASELPNYAYVKDTHRSIIYLNVGNCHMIEGTHNFSLRIFSKLAEKSRHILDPSKEIYQPNQLGKWLVEQYQSEFDDHDYIEIIHSPFSFSWQKKAIEYFCTHGIKLDLEKMFSPKDYEAYKYTHGLPFGC